MYALIVAQRENFRFRIDEPTKTKWMGVCKSRRLKQQQMMEALMAWFLAEESNQEKVLKHDRESQRGDRTGAKPKMKNTSVMPDGTVL